MIESFAGGHLGIQIRPVEMGNAHDGRRTPKTGVLGAEEWAAEEAEWGWAAAVLLTLPGAWRQRRRGPDSSGASWHRIEVMRMRFVAPVT